IRPATVSTFTLAQKPLCGKRNRGKSARIILTNTTKTIVQIYENWISPDAAHDADVVAEAVGEQHVGSAVAVDIHRGDLDGIGARRPGRAGRECAGTRAIEDGDRVVAVGGYDV